MSVNSVLQELVAGYQKGSPTLTAVHHQPARPARYGDWPAGLRPELVAALRARGVERLYSHQAEAVEGVLAGRHTVVVTPTASGKTLCYNLPVLQAILEDPTSRALYLFPTKALAQDQLAELQETIDALGAPVATFTYDGDTPADARRAIRSRAQVVITNPDMLHTGILPHHTRWSRLFANLRYVVLDELHTYRGVLGSHLTNLLRRLRRICRFHGSSPVFIMSSATIANPVEHARNLIEDEVVLVDQNGAPSGPRTLVFYNPPVLNQALGIRRSYLSAARSLAARFLAAGVQTIVFASSRLNVEVLTRALKRRFEKEPAHQGRIRGYRGGYLPSERREIERGLRQGTVQGVVSTNALELGIDIGALEAAVLAGYPGTVASTWQQIGRAGRRQSQAAAVLVARSDPLDQFVISHPEYFLGASPEQALVNPDNPAILVSHLQCAAFELPLEEDEGFGRAQVKEILEFLADKGVLHRSGGQYHWTRDVYPADAVSLRSASSENVVIMNCDEGNRVLAEVDFHSAPMTVYEDAIYMVQARTYQVKRFDYAQRRAYVRPVEVDYYTEAITSTAVRILDSFEAEARPSVVREHGEVHVAWRVSGFKKIKFDNRENVGYGEVRLPDQEMHTTSFWLTFPEEALATLGYPRADLLDGVVGLAYCLHHLAPFYLMCDVRDLNRCVGDRAGTWFAQADGASQGRWQFVSGESDEVASEPWMRTPAERGAAAARRQRRLESLARFEPTIYLYDNFPGGIGLSAPLYDLFDELWAQARARLAACQCEQGCPACVGPPHEVGTRARQVAQALLDLAPAPLCARP
jgi:DEAD/DEAH box helicase domain-containing protein